MGKEAGLFVPSGTMGNALALTVHTQSGDEVLMDSEAHSMIYEVGMPAVIARVLTRQFRSVQNGVPDVGGRGGFLSRGKPSFGANIAAGFGKYAQPGGRRDYSDRK